jgi:small subunit ribosomal protein S16
VERARYWLSNGAQPSDRVAWLFNKVGIVPDVPQRVSKTYLEVPKSIKKELESA